MNSNLADKGRMRITGNSKDSLKFKVPSLRNIAITAPYMHDGRLYTLTQVIEHYRNKINTQQPTIDSLLKNKMEISNQEKIDLLSFLYTLTDEELVKNKRYGDPQGIQYHIYSPTLNIGFAFVPADDKPDKRNKSRKTKKTGEVSFKWRHVLCIFFHHAFVDIDIVE